MGKIANISIKYYTDSVDLSAVYRHFFENNVVDFQITDGVLSYLVDFDGVNRKLEPHEKASEVLVGIIQAVADVPLVFTVIIDRDIVTNHTLNAGTPGEIHIAISWPKMIEEVDVPDFSFYTRRIIPFFDSQNIKSIEFWFG